MGKKRKHIESVAEPKKEEAAPERPARTLLGWKDKDQVTHQVENDSVDSPFFRNKEKVLVTCSRRISYRYKVTHFLYFFGVTITLIFCYDLNAVLV